MGTVPEALRYSKEHEWVRLEGKTATIGITDYAQHELGDIVYVELPAVGKELSQMGAFGTIEAVKTVSDLYSPVSGKVIEVNGGLSEHPEWVNQSPYEKGWLIKVEAKDPKEMEALLAPSDYKTLTGEGS